jgi:hypothetical protein
VAYSVGHGRIVECLIGYRVCFIGHSAKI